ncbi:acyl-CoA thioesterase [Vibrio vulnificus]|uniref:acyl-CoA thioesterase n=1 Tax=Vibrio vulnificus TaxID=672 RepID=UPI001EEBE487|nr:acyl-CoA thioesterase [Vibrio vulnificus]MCG6293770.1 acyl-CoA thioesterase [Vibrio vulnificus]
MSRGQRNITLRLLAEPGDVNFGGKVHGGAVMKWIDLAAYACSAAWSGKYCITAYAGGIRFVAPIHVGNLVEVSAKVIYTGTTSMHIAIDVQASDPHDLTNRLHPKDLKNRLTTHCIVIMVAVDENGQPTPIQKWIPETDEDKALEQSAIRLMNMRKEIGEEMEAHVKYLK